MHFPPRPDAALALLLVACALAGTGCATVAGTRQVVAIAADQPGIEVRDTDGNLLGKTPFFVRIERERQHQLSLRRPGTAPASRAEPFTFRCEYRLLASLLPNAAVASLAIGGGPLGVGLALGAGAGLDLWTGAAYDCPDLVVLPGPPTGSAAPVEEPAAPSPTQCHTVAVVPPNHADLLVSRQLAEQWWAEHAARRPCDRRVEPELADRTLRRLGMTHEAPVTIADRPRQQLNDLGLRTGATALAVLTVHTEADLLRVEPTVYDSFSLKGLPEPAFSVDLHLRAQPTWRRALVWVGSHVQLLPDSVGFAPTQKIFAFEAVDGLTLLRDEASPSWLPDLIGNWTLLSVDHPGRYRPWDGTLRFGPRVVFGFGSRQLRLGAGGAHVDAAVTLLELGGVYGVTGTGHTPGGALSAFLGAGLAGAWSWHNGVYQGGRAPVVSSAGVAWTAFLTENLFFRVDASSFASTKPQIVGPHYELRVWTAVSTTLGWYLPEWRSAVRGWFGSRSK